jgi:isopentenyl diphosphate isomerase/L-lactate dehydrogenase-like FMN-dependent dehydrogenase
VLRSFLAELDLTMALSGHGSVKEITQSALRAAPGGTTQA